MIFEDFVATDTPILSVRDSLIPQVGEEDRLEKLMKHLIAFLKEI